MPLTALEFYSGIGGLHLALKRSQVTANIVRAFDWDPSACKVYTANYGKDIVERVDISTLTASKLGHLKADIWLMSPSCQPYTVLNPQAQGAADPRAKSFMHIIEKVLPDMVQAGTQPQCLLVENVAGFESSTTRVLLVDTLHKLGYNVVELLLTPLQFGVPNSRLRYYLLAKLAHSTFANVDKENKRIWRHVPGYGQDWVDDRLADGRTAGGNLEEPGQNVAQLRDYLDAELPADATVIPDNVLIKWGRLFDIALPSARRTCCFTRGYTKMAERSGSVLQQNESLDTTTIFNSFLDAKASGDDAAVKLLAPLRLRYFSPAELLRLFCFDPPHGKGGGKFIWPAAVSSKTQYKLLGNSVNVLVVTALLNYLFE